MKSNVQRGQAYLSLNNSNRKTILDTVDLAQHVWKRKMINSCFTEKSLSAAFGIIVNHVDRWNQLLVERTDGSDWSAPVDISEKLDELTLDIMGDISFGASFNIKEPGDNPLKEIPHCNASFMVFFYQVSPSCPYYGSNFILVEPTLTGTTIYVRLMKSVSIRCGLTVLFNRNFYPWLITFIFYYDTNNSASFAIPRF